jgi:hypothetical protein
MGIVEDMILSRDVDSFSKVLEFWVALTRSDGLDSSPATDFARLDAAVAFAKGDIAAFEHVVAYVVPQLPLKGARIQLLPFLSGSTALSRFGEDVASQIWPLTQVGAGESRLSYLSKQEVCTILKLSPSRLTELITRGDINWPDNGSRQQKIAITESELRMHGFSQTEILCAYPERVIQRTTRRVRAKAKAG